MKIKKIKDKNPSVSFWIVESTWKASLDENWNKEYIIIPWWEYMLYDCVSQKIDLDWENWIKEIIAWIKNVKIIKEEHDKKAKREEEDLEWLWEEDEDYITINWLQSDQAKELFTKEQLSQTYYCWSWWELWYAHSYSDITVCFDNFSDKEEYYKTSEVLEVLEKWKEALERWNNPEEKKKMIEEYEKSKKED